MTSAGSAAEAARAAFRARLSAPGHAVENVRAAVAALEEALAAGTLQHTPTLDLMLGDLRVALDAGTSGVDEVGESEGEGAGGPADRSGHPGGRLGGKSADAARRIGAAIARELTRA